MKTRVISGLIMLPFGIIVLLGGKVLMLGCFIIGIMSVREFFNGFTSMGIKPGYLLAYVSTLALYGLNLFVTDARWYMLWFFGVVLLSLLYLFNIQERRLEDGMATLTGILYTVFFSFHVTLVEQTGEYGLLVWLIFLTAFGTDVMAYFTGYAFGKHKLCPHISPKKTIEGSIGGILGSVLLCGVFGWVLIPRLLIHCLIIGLMGGIVSQFGDLTASIFKRKMGIKDYGNLIPGHGGILDRFDSVLFTAPMVYYYIALVL
ncbi:phosphatidate cytidylyltransferase [Aminipila butyrica]|uniref:Phosphatidate cytidylyltransferase n=1 Tax=Aminipila butyrica TaxID=433296 RepID=A0A858BUJ5_9FIRM|nr:phosphatidate cytidylyltransferase [Aminipila butyrica]QIB69032.1 phosphatidate cytidylyltransferase [Aminipila butyrica]